MIYIRSIGETKRLARSVLKNNWGEAVLVTLLSGIISAAAIFVAVVFAVVFGSGSLGTSAFLSSIRHYARIHAALPVFSGVALGLFLALFVICVVTSVATAVVNSNLQTGSSLYYLNLAGRTRPSLSNLFEQFKRSLFKPLGISLLVFLKVILWLILGLVVASFLVPFIVMTIYSNDILSVVLAVLARFAIILAFVPAIITSYSYSMVYFVLADNENISISDALRTSKELMRGNRFEFFLLQLSFIGWAFLCYLTWGIGYFFLIPYINASSAVFYCGLCGKNVPENEFNPYAEVYPAKSDTPEKTQENTGEKISESSKRAENDKVSSVTLSETESISSEENAEKPSDELIRMENEEITVSDISEIGENISISDIGKSADFTAEPFDNAENSDNSNTDILKNDNQ